MTKILLKVLDKIIFPAAALVVSKIIGLYLATQIWNLDWYIQNYSTRDSFFSVRFLFTSPEAALDVNTFSNMFMYGVIFTVCLVMLFRAYFLHDSHQNPKIISRLARMNLLSAIADTKDITTDSFVWFSALWIATIICIYAALTEAASLWIAPVTFILALFTSTILIADLDKELGEEGLSAK